MTEIHLKSYLTYLLLGAKLIVGVWIFFMWKTGGFSLQEVLEILTVIGPLFSVHLTVVLDYYLENRIKTDTTETSLKTPTSCLSILLPLMYMFSLFIIINLKPLGEVSFANMKVLLGGVETIFGVYLSKIIAAFFKTERQSVQQDAPINTADQPHTKG